MTEENEVEKAAHQILDTHPLGETTPRAPDAETPNEVPEAARAKAREHLKSFRETEQTLRATGNAQEADWASNTLNNIETMLAHFLNRTGGRL